MDAGSIPADSTIYWMKRLFLVILLTLLASCALRYQVRVEQQELPYPERQYVNELPEYGVFVIIEVKRP